MTGIEPPFNSDDGAMMPPTAMRVIRTYAAEIVRLRDALRRLDEWCPSIAPFQDEIDALTDPDRKVPVVE